MWLTTTCSHDREISILSFDALKAIADYHVRSKGGFSQQEKAFPEFTGHFMKTILTITMFEDFNQEITEKMAETLFMLIVWNEVKATNRANLIK